MANGVVYVTSNTGAVTALNANTGANLWSYKNGLPGSPAVVNGMVYVGLNFSPSIYAFGLE